MKLSNYFKFSIPLSRKNGFQKRKKPNQISKDVESSLKVYLN